MPSGHFSANRCINLRMSPTIRTSLTPKPTRSKQIKSRSHPHASLGSPGFQCTGQTRRVGPLICWHSLIILVQCDNEVEKIEKLVIQYRNEHERKNKGKMSPHPRVRGEWKDTPLPFIAGSKHRIPRFAIHPE